MRPSIAVAMVLLIAVPCAAQNEAPSHGTFYDGDVVQDIRLEVLPDDLKRMRAALPERIYVPATFRWNDVVLKRVGLRYKGNSSSNPRQTHKRGFLIKFSEFVDKQRFLGLRRVALDNGVQFGSLFSERLITDILREVGVPASRSNYARLELNGEFLGVYVNVERVDRAFLKRNFPGKKGALYKVHTGGPGADLRFVGEDPLLYGKAFELKSGKKRANTKDLVTFIKGVDSRGGADFDLRANFDVDSFVWQMGVLLLAGAFDQYTGWGPHNYYLFQTDRWHYLTWDLDVGFADRAFGRVPVIEGWNAAWPIPRAGRPLLEQVVNDAKLLALYRERTQKLLETQFAPKRLAARLDQLYAQIEDDLKRDPFQEGRITNREDRSYEDAIASMKRFMVKRHRTALAQLAEPGPRPKLRDVAARRRNRGPRPGQWSKGAPSELSVVRATGRGVELKWRDNATGEHGFIVQRAAVGADQPFRNLMGIPGENLTSATDKKVRSGQAYRYRVFAVKPTANGAVGTEVSNVVTARVTSR